MPQEVDTDRGRFPAQRRKRRTKAELAAARAGSTEARDEAFAGLAKLQQAKASEDSQGGSVGSAVLGFPAAAVPPSKPGTQSSPAPVPPAPPNSQIQGAALNAPSEAQPPSLPTAGHTDPTPVNMTMHQAMHDFHYPNPGAANQPVGPYRTHANPHPAQESKQPLSAYPPNPNLAHLSHTSQYDQTNSFYGPYPPLPSAGPAAQKTVWPESSRAAIAAAAQATLMADPQNAGKFIAAETIVAMLEKQLNYVQLCDIFERRYGFVLDRRHFAHSILQAVPSPKSSTTNGVNSTDAKAAQQQSAPTLNMSSANGSTRRESTGKGKQKQLSPADVKLAATPPSEQGPLTKAGMARKRTFADLVDLTVESDEEDRIKRLKLAQLANDNVTSAAGGSSSRDPSRVRNEDVPSHPLLMPPAPKESEKLDMSSLKNFTLSAAREALRTAEIAQQIDPSKARPVGKYKIKTLARDILIAAGKHETEAPLNFHLFGLKDIYKHVHQSTDLSTLRWDIMDPGRPEPGTSLEDLKNEGEGEGMDHSAGEKVDADVVAQLGRKKKKKLQQALDGAKAVDTETADDSTAVQNSEPGRSLIPNERRPDR